MHVVLKNGGDNPRMIITNQSQTVQHKKTGQCPVSCASAQLR
jgi:uncharacterized protein YodC (DUF2158 family)